MSTRRQLIVLGAGGHAKVLICALRLAGAPLLGITDPAAQVAQHSVLGVPVLGDDERVFAYPPQEVELVNGLGCVTSSASRRELFERFSSRGYTFTTVKHPAAIISPYTSLGEGAQCMAGAIIQAGGTVGANSILNTGSQVDHDCQIGNHVHIAPGAILAGDVHVADGAIIGAGAVLIQGIHIGAGALVGAGAVVHRRVASGERVAGVPARPMNLG